jgi:hypothetical protein
MIANDCYDFCPWKGSLIILGGVATSYIAWIFTFVSSYDNEINAWNTTATIAAYIPATPQ